jgi:hypothetical protein
VSTVLAVSAGNDFLHSGFTWLCSRANAAEARGDGASEQRPEVGAPRAVA